METTTLIISIVLILAAIWFAMPEPEFMVQVKKHYLNSWINNKITPEPAADDFISDIADELALLDETLYKGQYLEPKDMDIKLWSQSQQHMAGIIMAVTNMAEYYEVDILAEINKYIKHNEQRK